ncbi:uncharacterized protein [Miscanthus floridulus]|uniref:uncharacterized protein n=1 Tax=Miscanthus floridulus TaxID=154761 RepID=UPI0034585453
MSVMNTGQGNTGQSSPLHGQKWVDGNTGQPGENSSRRDEGKKKKSPGEKPSSIIIQREICIASIYVHAGKANQRKYQVEVTKEGPSLSVKTGTGSSSQKLEIQELSNNSEKMVIGQYNVMDTERILEVVKQELERQYRTRE